MRSSPKARSRYQKLRFDSHGPTAEACSASWRVQIQAQARRSGSPTAGCASAPASARGERTAASASARAAAAAELRVGEQRAASASRPCAEKAALPHLIGSAARRSSGARAGGPHPAQDKGASPRCWGRPHATRYASLCPEPWVSSAPPPRLDLTRSGRRPPSFRSSSRQPCSAPTASSPPTTAPRAAGP